MCVWYLAALIGAGFVVLGLVFGAGPRERVRALFGELQPGENSSCGFNCRGTRGDPLPLQQLHSTLSKQI